MVFAVRGRSGFAVTRSSISGSPKASRTFPEALQWNGTRPSTFVTVVPPPRYPKNFSTNSTSWSPGTPSTTVSRVVMARSSR